MTIHYRITTRRFDDRGPAKTYSEHSFEDTDMVACDGKAKDDFKTVSLEPSNAWENMRLLRIDQPATPGPERTTLLAEVREYDGDGDALDLVG